MKTPIKDFLNEYAAKGMSRFHMPGHKGLALEDMIDPRHDITEVQGADSLYEADGIIAASEENAASLFNTAATFYSVEGSSQCIRAMLALVTEWEAAGRKASDKRPVILAARNVHRSFLTAAALLDLNVEWLYPENEDFTLCSCPVSAEQIRLKLANMSAMPDAVYLTSPDYLGGMQDIRGISQAAHESGIPLIVDNAHGAYLAFLEPSLHPIALGADMCCDSAHKTLPSLTGCAYLHISKEAENKEKYITYARRALALFGSTSPSYLLLSSLDQTNVYIAEKFRAQLAECIRNVSACKETAMSLGFAVTESEPLKITIAAKESGISGEELACLLRNGGIECEYADRDHVVLMPSPFNDDGDFRKLSEALRQISEDPCGRAKKTGISKRLPTPEKVLTIRQAMFAAAEEIPTNLSEGRIAACDTLSCPPAVPVVVCGERIPEGAAEIFALYGIDKVTVTICR